MVIVYINPHSDEYKLLTINPLPDNADFLRLLGKGLSKTMWENEKMLVASMFFVEPACGQRDIVVSQ